MGSLEEDDYWTEEQIAEYLGIQIASVRSFRQRHGIKSQLRAPAAAVRAAKEAAPGKGRRGVPRLKY